MMLSWWLAMTLSNHINIEEFLFLYILKYLN
jgi:hypothetical protein